MIPFSTEAQVRRAFWDEHQELAARISALPSKRGLPALQKEAAVAFGLFVAELVKNGEIESQLVQRVTLA